MSEPHRERPAPGASVYPRRPDDPRAVVLAPGTLGAVGDGKADDAPALQAAIDSLQPAMERTAARRALRRHELPCGIVLLGEGTYRLRSTLRIWWGVRVIGFGERRPTLLLGPRTPGFAGGEDRPLVHFCGPRPPEGRPAPDARNSTFFSGLSNVNVRVAEGNAAAVGVRFNVAQHCSVEHVDFRLEGGRAGIAQAGNEVQGCRFFGGEVGLKTGRTSAGWQLLVTDCVFERQRTACIETREAGLTAVRCVLRDAPRGVVVPPGEIEKLYLKDCLLEGLSAGVEMDASEDPACQANAEDVVCVSTPTFVQARGGEPAGRDAEAYVVQRFSAGLHVEDALSDRPVERTRTVFDAEPLDAPPDRCAAGLPPAEPDVPPLPPMDQWVNIREVGAGGDGETDDTAALRDAAGRGAVYLPQGRYRITDTVELGPETTLIGLHPGQTQIVLADGTDGFTDRDATRPMLATPPGGRNLVTGLGTNPGRNPGATAVLWRAGGESAMDDVFFDWSRSGSRRKGQDAGVSLRVTGGGTFRNVWTANYHAPCGLRVSGDGPARVYLMSVEHHRGAEVVLEGASGWAFYALQTEENVGSEQATALVLDGCGEVRFANLFLYRVMGLSRRHPCGMRVSGCKGVRIRGLHVFSLGAYPFDAAARDPGTGRRLARREAAWVEL
jgi:hypothetical protein